MDNGNLVQFLHLMLQIAMNPKQDAILLDDIQLMNKHLIYVLMDHLLMVELSEISIEQVHEVQVDVTLNMSNQLNDTLHCMIHHMNSKLRKH